MPVAGIFYNAAVNIPRRLCVLFSGGFDSGVLLADMLRRGHEVYPLYVRSGFIWERAELHWLNKFLTAHKTPRLKSLTIVDSLAAPLVGAHWSLSGRGTPGASSAWDSVYLPGRNLILLSQAAVFCGRFGLKAAAFAILKGNPFSDASPKFLRAMEKTAGMALGIKLSFLAPYLKLDKEQVAGLLPSFPARLTFSCLKPRGLRHCGHCSKCGERKRACAE